MIIVIITITIIIISVIPLSTNIEYDIPRYSGLSPYHSPV